MYSSDPRTKRLYHIIVSEMAVNFSKEGLSGENMLSKEDYSLERRSRQTLLDGQMFRPKFFALFLRKGYTMLLIRTAVTGTIIHGARDGRVSHGSRTFSARSPTVRWVRILSQVLLKQQRHAYR